MRRTIAVLSAVVLLAACTAAKAGTATTGATGTTESSAATIPSPAAASGSSLTEIGAGLQGPPGLTAVVYGTGLANVSAFAFDPAGRLWAATAAYDDAGTDAIYLVAEAGARPVRVIADQHTPLGLAWAGDTLYVASAGGVDAYNGLADGVFTRHETVLTLPAGVGEANGLVMSSDGRLVLGVSAPCDACTPTTDAAAAVISFLRDGSDVRVEASGIRAPVGLVFDPGTDDLFVTMNQRDDLGDATPGDWLSVVRSGQAWGFPDCYGQGGSACDGVPLPVAELDAHAAVSGVAILTDELGPALGSSALVAEWAKGVVLRVALTHEGETYAGTVEPFLAGLKNPVPVVVTPDRAVLVGDWGTGTIYRITGS